MQQIIYFLLEIWWQKFKILDEPHIPKDGNRDSFCGDTWGNYSTRGWVRENFPDTLYVDGTGMPPLSEFLANTTRLETYL